MRTLILLLILGCGLQAETPRGLLPPERREIQPRAAEGDNQTVTVDKDRVTTPPAAVVEANATGTAQPSADGTSVRYFGHAFAYLTSTSGVRIALNPFSPEAGLGYKFPRTLPADLVLISAESPEYSGGQDLMGLPQVFRSLTGIGANRANGIPFRGIATFRDAREGRQSGGNTVYVIEVDGLKFCHLGGIGHLLSRSQAAEIGFVDVLFLPVGNRELSVPELWKMADMLKAHWIVPVGYKTEKSGNLELRSLSEFDAHGHPVKELPGTEFSFRQTELPATPSVLIFKSP